MHQSDLPPSVRDAVASIVAEVLHPMDQIRILGTREDYYVLEVATNSRTVVVKLAGPTASEPSLEEAAAPHELAARLTGVPLAELVDVDDSMNRIPFRYSVQLKIEGETWFVRRARLNADEQSQALNNIAMVVAELHSPPVAGYGRLQGDVVALAEPLLAALHRHADRIVATPRLRDRFHDILERRQTSFLGEPRSGITHEDLHGFNILFSPSDPTGVAAVLDFDKAWIGPVESDLARMELWRGMTTSSSTAVYRERIASDDGYEERRPIYQLLWCYEFASSDADHRKLTEEIEARLG